MSRWKPGDVVTATVNGRPNVRLIAGWSKYDPRLRWGELSTRWADGDDDECWFMPSQVTDHRPLVVIDPEDAEQVRRLTAAYCGARDNPDLDLYRVSDILVSALREFATPTPPKPDEPRGLGAVVEDAEGLRWVRHAGMFALPWYRANASSRTWAEIDAVRVLSEGVTP